MANKKKLQERDWRYDALHGYVNLFVKASYRNISYVGLERIPNDGAVIFAPNHSGALMDAMVVVAMNSGPTVFLARADIFKNPKLAKILTFFKMMPIMRMRDGIEEVKKNNKTIETAADVLKDKVPLCLFPEGTHQAKHSMLPLSKGIFRIALQAKELLGDKPLYIVPIGIRYGNFFRFRSSARVQFGNPINVGEFIAEHSDKTAPEQINLMREQLTVRMRENIHYIPNNEQYDAKKEICAAMYGQQLKNSKKEINPLVSLNQTTAEQIESLQQEKPEVAEKLIALGNEAAELRKKKRISLKSVAKPRGFFTQAARALLLLATLPYTLFATVCTSPVTLLCRALEGKFKDKAFLNSVRCVIKLLLWPLLFITYTVLAFVFLPHIWAIAVVIALLPVNAVTHDTFRAMRMVASDLKFSCNKPLQEKYDEIRKFF